MATFNYDSEKNESREVPDFKYDPNLPKENESGPLPLVSENLGRSKPVVLSSEEKLIFFKIAIFLVGSVTLAFLCYKIFPIPPGVPEDSRSFSHFTRIGGSLAVAGILATDVCIRIFLSFIISSLLTAAAWGFAKLLNFTENAVVWLCLPVALLGILGGYVFLAESSWIGRLCSRCGKRGKISEDITGSDYQGSEQRNTSSGFKTFAIYKVHHEKTCGHCGAIWTWTTERHEQRN